MRRRWFIYIIIGIVFGVFDFYFQAFIQNYSFDSSFLGGNTRLILILGVWLILVIPIGLYEVKISKSRVLPALASSLIWCASVISYYLNNAVQLAFIGFSTRPELNISNHKDPFFWSNWKSVFLNDIIGGSVEWLVVAVVGGSIIGFLISFIYLHIRKTNNVKTV